MNIFLKYGIKEVADVTFYSIVRVDKEEFYVPVLFLDTLKISSLNKSLENSVRYGGYGNSSTVSWNFEKGATIKLEDALFSQMSMNMFLNGQVSTSMSNWISAIAKLNVANTYGNKNYSTKAYPSPTLTPKEWDIIYRCAQKVGYFSNASQNTLLQFSTSTKASQYIYEEDKQDGDVNKYVAKNRWKLMDNYYKRTQPSILPVNIAPYIDFNRELSDSISLIHLNVDNKGWQLEQIREMTNIKDVVKIETPILIKWHNKKDTESYSLQTSSQFNASGQNLVCTFKRNDNKWNCIEAYVTLNKSSYNNIISNLRKQAFDVSAATGTASSYIHYKNRYYIGNEFFLNNAVQFLFPLCLDDEIKSIGYNNFNKITYKAMPKEIIDEIMNEVTTQQKIGGFNNNLSFSDSIDRMEKCVVTDPYGLDIDLVQQSKNIQKKYTNVQENYSILYDAKTMLPFVSDDLSYANDYSQKAIYIDNTMYNSTPRTEKEKLRVAIKYYNKTCGVNVDSSNYVVTKIETPSDVDSSLEARLYYIKFNQPKIMHLRPGTVYYKWSRTIPTDSSNTYIGTDIDISTDYFSGEYMIVGETLIRNQMTGQDEHYQLVLNRTTVSQCANLQLQAGGNPVTFSMELNVLQPKVDKPMAQLRQFKTIEDKQYGGNKIIPQLKQHVQTITDEVIEQEIETNNEIY